MKLRMLKQKGGVDHPKVEPETEEDRRNLEFALGNFALMLVEPVEIDWCALGIQPNKRTVFKREGERWSEQLVAP